MADGKVIIDTALDSSGAIKGISQLKSGITGAITTIGKIGTAGVAAGATLAGALAKSAVDSYGEYEQLVGGIETLFEDAQETVFENAKKAYATAGLNQNEYMENVISYAASLKKSAKDEYEAAQIADQIIIDMSDNVNKMGTDMEMVQNAYRGFTRQNYVMLDNLALGYAGSKTGMEELLADAEKLTGVHYEIGNMADMANAIHAIQVEMGITGTTAEEAGATLQGSARAAKAAWDNLLTGLADDNADIDVLIDNFVTQAEGAFNNMFPRIVKAIEGVGNLIERLLPTVLDKLPDIITSAVPGLISAGITLVKGLVQGIAKSAPQIATMFKDLGSEIIKNLPALWEAISGLFEGLSTVDFGEAQEIGSNLFDKIASGFDKYLPTALAMGSKVIQKISDGIKTNFPIIMSTVGDILTTMLETLNELLPQIYDWIIETAPTVFDTLFSLIPPLLEQIPPILAQLFEMIAASVGPATEMLAELTNSLLESLPDVIAGLVDAIPDIIGGLLEAIISHTPDVILAGLDLLGSLLVNLPGILEALGNGIIDLVAGLVEMLINLIPTIAEAGQKLFEGLIERGPDILDGIKNFALGLVSAILSILGNLIGKLSELATTILEGVGDVFATAWDWLSETIGGFVTDVIDGIVGFFTDAWDDVTSIGTNLVEGIWEGISGATGWLMDQISGFAGDVVDNITGLFGISSPSKVMRDQVGRYLAEGIWVGFDENNPMNQINNDLKHGMRGLNTTLTVGNKTLIDYDKIGESVTDGFVNANVKVAVDNREFGRLERGYA